MTEPSPAGSPTPPPGPSPRRRPRTRHRRPRAIRRRPCRSPGGWPGRRRCSFRCGSAAGAVPTRTCRWCAGSIPAQLLSTGAKSLVSLLVGEQSDRRIVQALAARRQEYYDHTIHYRDGARGPQPRHDARRDELWIDFACDTGDGFNPTYAVAYAMAQPSLTVSRAGRPDRPCRAATCWSSAATRSIRPRAARSTSAGWSRRTRRPSATTCRPSGRTSTPSRAITTGTTACRPSPVCSAPTSADGASPAGGRASAAATSC